MTRRAWLASLIITGVVAALACAFRVRERAVSLAFASSEPWARALESGLIAAGGSWTGVTSRGEYGPLAQAVALGSTALGASAVAAWTIATHALAWAGAMTGARALQSPLARVAGGALALLFALEIDAIEVVFLYLGLVLTARSSLIAAAPFAAAILWRPDVSSFVAVALIALAIMGRRRRIASIGALTLLALAPWFVASLAHSGLSLFAESLLPNLSAARSVPFGVFFVLAILLAVWQKSDDRALNDVARAAPIAGLAAFLAGVSAIAWPAATAIVLASLRARKPVARQLAALLAALLAFGAARFSRAGRDSLPLAPADDVEERAVAWARKSSDGCVWLHGDLEGMRLRGLLVGPGDPLRATRGAELAQKLVDGSPCERAIVSADPAFLGADLITLSETHRPRERLGRSLFGWLRRASRARAVRRAVGFHGAPDVRVDQAVRADALLELEVEPDGPFTRRVDISVRDASSTRSESTIPLERAGRQSIIVPVSPRAAAWRFAGGASSEELLDAGLTLGVAPASVQIHAVREVLPPEDHTLEEPLACNARASLVAMNPIWIDDDRHASASGEGFDLAPVAQQSARIDVPVVPCANACLYAQIGVVEGPSAEVRVELLSRGETLVLSSRTLGPSYRQPVEVPLASQADRSIAIGFVATTSGRPARVRVHRPRVEPCVSMFSVVHALHERRFTATNGESEVESNELRIALRPPHERPPRIEVPLRVGERACLSVVIEGRGLEGNVSALVGVRRGAHLFRFAREVLQRGSQQRALDGASLERFAGQDVRLVFAAWSLTDRIAGRVAFIRPRIHRCGEDGWGFP